MLRDAKPTAEQSGQSELEINVIAEAGCATNAVNGAVPMDEALDELALVLPRPIFRIFYHCVSAAGWVQGRLGKTS